MNRRKFTSTAALGLALSTSASASTIKSNLLQTQERALVEWRSYHMKWGKNSELFMDYLTSILKPAMLKAGASSVLIFKETSTETPTNIYMQIAHPNMTAYQNSLNVSTDPDFITATSDYDSQDASVFSRMTTSLIHSYTSFPQPVAPLEENELFEFRLYEGYNEDAVRRKNAMFNIEETQYFLDLGFHPIFFGEVVAGPLMPAMAYMLSYKDMADRKTKWGEFLSDQRWKDMLAKPEYADTVSNIHNVFLKKVG